MSCNGCRVLQKGCSDNCMLRQSLRCIESPQAQGHATLFVAKFFGRASLLSFLSAVPRSQRPTLFRSLLFEAVGRTVSPVNGAVGLLWSGNWRLCQEAVETVLRGGIVRASPEQGVRGASEPEPDTGSEAGDNCCLGSAMKKRKVNVDDVEEKCETANLELSLTSSLPESKKRRQYSTSSSEGSETTTLSSVSVDDCRLQQSQTEAGERNIKLLRLFF